MGGGLIFKKKKVFGKAGLYPTVVTLEVHPKESFSGGGTAGP
jgi:hypothetical protein